MNFIKFNFLTLFIAISILFILGCSKSDVKSPSQIHQNSLAASLLNEGLVILDPNGIDIYYPWNNTQGLQVEEKIPYSDKNLFSEAPISDQEILNFFYLYSNSSDDISKILAKWEQNNPQKTEEEKLVSLEVRTSIELLIEKREKLLQKEGLRRIRNINLLWKEYVDLLDIKENTKAKRKRKLERIDNKIEELTVRMSLNGYHPLIEKKLLALPATGKIIPVREYTLYDNGEIKSIVPLTPVKLKLNRHEGYIKCKGRIEFYKKGRVKNFYTKDQLSFSLPGNNKFSVKGARISLYPNEELQSITNVKPFSLYLPNGDVSLAKSVTYSIKGELLSADFPLKNMPAIKLADGTLMKSTRNEYTRLGKLIKIYSYNDISIILPTRTLTKLKGSKDSLKNSIIYYPSGTLKRAFLKEPTDLYIPQFQKEVKLKNEIIFSPKGSILSGELFTPENVLFNGTPTTIEGSFQFYSSGSPASAKLLSYNLKSFNPNTYISYSEKTSPVKISLYPAGKLKNVLFDKKSGVYIKSGNRTYLKGAAYTESGKISAIELYSGTVKVLLPENLGSITAAREISFNETGVLAQTTTIHSFPFPLDVKTRLKIPSGTFFACYASGALRSCFIELDKGKTFYIQGFALTSSGMVELYSDGSIKSYNPTESVEIMLPDGLMIKTTDKIEFYSGGILKKVTPEHSVKIEQRNLPYRFNGTLFYRENGNLSKIEFFNPTKISLGQNSGAMVKVKSTANFTSEGILYQFDL